MRVTIDDRGVSCHWPDGSETGIAWGALRAVTIRTTDAGPREEDVFLVLEGAGAACCIPQGADGSDELLERLQRLPGFDNEAVIAAMGCTDNATFPCWRRIDPP